MRRTLSKVQKKQDLNLAAADFVTEHLQTEKKHLQAFEKILLPHERKHTALLPIWRMCGFLLGYIPTFVKGPVYLFHTVDAVETFVETHYNEQIEFIEKELLNSSANKDAENSTRDSRINSGNSKNAEMIVPKKTSKSTVLASKIMGSEGVLHDPDTGKPTLALLSLLRSFKDDEVSHKDDARERLRKLVVEKSGSSAGGGGQGFGVFANTWRWIVGNGSAYAAALARRV